MTIQVIQIHQIFLLLPEVEAAEEDEKVVEVPAEEVRVAETVKMVVMQVLQAAQPEDVPDADWEKLNREATFKQKCPASQLAAPTCRSLSCAK